MHRVLFILVLAFIAQPTMATADDGAATGRPTFGGLGHTSIGVGAIQVSGVDAPLRAALGDCGAVGPGSWRYGGGGKMLLFGLILGGKGYGFEYFDGSGSAGTARMSGGGGGFQLGYAIHRSAKALVYPLIGFGGYGIDIELDNTSDSDITFGDQIVAGASASTFQSGYWAAEVGVGVDWLLMYGGDGGQGGWSLGAELGLQMSVATSEWDTSDGATIGGVAQPRMVGGYLWLHLGGGGFFLR
jgi:hypothetical protein